jgi:arabinofuranan 3-O-arabinosyltransferase
VTADGSPLLPYLVSLRSPGSGGWFAPASPGSVLSQGHGSDGSRSDVRLSVRSAAWLVLGESYARGWRATCRSDGGGERDLGDPQPIDGFANGWRIDPKCATASFRFGPQRLALGSYLLSALAGLVVLALLVAGALARRRRGRPNEVAEDSTEPPPDPLLRLGPVPALALAAGLGALGAWFFAIRAGFVLAVGVAVFTSAGVSARRLLWLATAALVVIPVLYIADPISGEHGFFAYANDHQAAHWVAVVAVCALAGACLLDGLGWRRVAAPEQADP